MIDDGTAELARLLLANADPRPFHLVQGVVDEVEAGGRISVFLSGASFSIGNVRCIDGYVPTAGEVVWLFKNGPDLMAFGTMSDGTRMRFDQEAIDAILADALAAATDADPALSKPWTDISNHAALTGVTLGTGGDFEAWARYDIHDTGEALTATCEVSMNVVLGVGGSVPSQMIVTLPNPTPWNFTAKNRGPYAYKWVGSAHILDAGVRHHAGSCRVTGGGRTWEFFHAQVGASGTVGPGGPMTWGGSDEIGAYIRYELANVPA